MLRQTDLKVLCKFKAANTIFTVSHVHICTEYLQVLSFINILLPTSFPVKDHLINRKQLSIMLWLIQQNRSAVTDNETSLIPFSKITSQTQVFSIQKSTVNPYQIFTFFSFYA